MKILYICNEYPPYPHGGIGVFVKNLVENLTQNGVECIVTGIYNISEDKIEIINGVKIYRYKLPKILHLTNNAFINVIIQIIERYYLSNKVKSLNKLHNFNLIESYEWTGPLFRKPKSPLLIRLHGSNTAHAVHINNKKSRVLFFWEKKNISMADCIVSVSSHILKITEDAFGQINQPKSVIYNSINTDLFKPFNDVYRDPNKIIFVGKFHERKGVFELFHILSYLLNSNSEYHFQFVGNHNDEQKLELTNLLGSELRERVSFTNAIPQNQLPEIYNQAAIMIMPSRAEAFGLTVIEAMACGCLVAMSNIEVGKELINDGIDGILINPFEYEVASRKIANLLEDKNLSDYIRRNALKKIETVFSNHVLIHKNIENYKSLVLEIDN